MDRGIPCSQIPVTPAILALEGVTKAFGGILAVKELTMGVRPRELTGLIGPNGSGKTVTLNLCSGVYPPDAGVITFKDTVLNGLAPWEISRLGLSRTFQTLRLWGKMTVLENVMTAYGRFMPALFGEALAQTPRARREEAKARQAAIEALDLVGMASFANKMAEDLSLGQQRLVELARALVSKPSCILLDEPASGLRGELVVQLGAFLKWLADERDTAFLVVEHRTQLVMQFCARVIVLNYGEKIAEGSPEEIRNDERVVAAYLGRRRGECRTA